MRFGHIELDAMRPEVTRDFYVEHLGFTLVADQGTRFQWIARDGLEILLREGPPGSGVGIVLYTDDPAAEAVRLREAGLEVGEVGNCFVLEDPDHHRVEIVNPNDDHSEG